MEKPRIEYAQKLARKVLRDCRIQNIPVDIKQIVSELGYTYIEVPTFSDGVDALFIEQDGEQYAAVNANHHIHRKRFSLAHELGHIQMGHILDYYDEPSSIDNPPIEKRHSDNGKLLDKEANAFAGELLVPLDMLKNEFRKTKDIDTLAKVFSVSPDVISIAVITHERSLYK